MAFKQRRRQSIIGYKIRKAKKIRRSKYALNEQLRCDNLFEIYYNTSSDNQTLLRFKYILNSDNPSISYNDTQITDHNGNTLLHLTAMFSNKISLFQSLIDNGADIESLNNEGYKPYILYFFDRSSGKKREIINLLTGH